MVVIKIISRLFRAIILGVILAIIILAFVISPARVSGASMLPSISDNSLVLLLKAYQSIGYGDVVAIDSRTKRPRTIIDNFTEFLKNVCSRNDNAQNYNFWVKRVIGLPGDVLEIREGNVFRNGKRVIEPYILESMQNEPFPKYVIPENCIFVMGDNRNYSVDSRKIGPVPLDHVLGVVVFW